MSNRGKITYIDQSVIDQYDNEQVLLFPLKESEAIILLTFVDFIAWRTRWNNLTYTQSELDAIQASIADGLMNPTDLGDCIVATPEELAQAVCDGLLCAVPTIGQTLAAGINSGISVKVDETTGEIIVDDGSGGEEAGSVGGTTDEKRWGGSLEVYEGILEYMTDFEDFFNQFPADQATAVSFMSQKWLVTADITTAVSDYYAHRNLANPAPAPLPQALEGEYWCNGATKQTTASYVIDNIVNDLLLILSMVGALSQDQYDQWFNRGYEVPRLGFDSAPCYTVPAQTRVFNYDDGFFGVQLCGVFTGLPDNHYWRVSSKCTELFINDAGDEWDGVYFKPASGSESIYYPLWQDSSFSYSIAEGVGAKLAIGQIYNYEILRLGAVNPRCIRVNLGGTWLQGSMEITMSDLGLN